jgi:hypothetical protein
MSTWANTPVGANTLLDYDFNKSTLASVGILDAYNSSIAATDATAPISPSSVLKSRIEAGSHTGGMQLNYVFNTYTDMFVGLTWRSNAAFEGRPQGNKTFFMRGPGSNGFFLWGNESLVAGSHAMIWSFNTSGLDNSHITGSTDPGVPLFPNITSGTLTRGNWYRLEAYVKKSTTNTSRDGTVRWWINGVLVGNYTNINYAGAGLNEWVWSETWDGAPNFTVTTAWEHYLDHLFIASSGAPPSGGGGTPTLTSLVPSAVTLAPGNAQVLTAGMSAAVSGSTSIALVSSAPSIASVGSTAVVSPGNSSTNFTVTGVSAGTATITATLGSAAQTSTVTVATSGGTGTPVTYSYASQFSSVQGQNQWSYRDTGGNLLVFNSGANKWEGDQLYLSAWSSGFVHGYNGGLKGAVVRWTAPAAGTVSLSGTALLYETPASGTFTVALNSTTLFSQAMSPSTSYPYSASGLAVVAGDVIDFSINGTSNTTNDNTQLNPVIVFTPTTTGSGSVTVSSMTPSHGNIGSSVTIVGTGFSATAVNNTITVNGTPATITSSSTTQLIFTVPASATTGLVNVATSAGSVSAGTYTVDNPTTPDTPPASNFGGSAMLLLVMP